MLATLRQMVIDMERIIQATEATSTKLQSEIDATVRILSVAKRRMLQDASGELEDTAATASVVRS